MTVNRHIPRLIGLFTVALGLAISCGFDSTLRAYLDIRFWLPFAKQAQALEPPGIQRVSLPYAGMDSNPGDPSLLVLSLAYQGQCEIEPKPNPCNPAMQQQSLAVILANPSVPSIFKEEARLIAAKIEMRRSEQAPATLGDARKLFEEFLRTAKSPRYISEAMGWLAYIHRLQGNQTAAGKIYIDELNRSGSNLSRETLLSSLKMTYGYDGGPGLVAHMDEYFDTPQHAIFAIQLLTNPHWHTGKYGDDDHPESTPDAYKRIKLLLATHRNIFRLASGSGDLALLTMRLALRMGDPAEAARIASMIPSNSAARSAPDFLWMQASAQFLSHQYAGAEQPLLNLFNSRRASSDERSAAAYGLCAVYFKTANSVERLRYALWLSARSPGTPWDASAGSEIGDMSIYWAKSGWDLNLMLEDELSVDELRAFLSRYPSAPRARLVTYAIAVRLARADQYTESAELYTSIGENRRAGRMKELAALFSQANRTGTTLEERHTAKFQLAQYIGSNPERLYFNASLWHGLQAFALTAATDSRLTADERSRFTTGERNLRDTQEERWRAYRILRDLAMETEPGPARAKYALAGRSLLVQISERFGRQDEIRKANAELAALQRR